MRERNLRKPLRKFRTLERILRTIERKPRTIERKPRMRTQAFRSTEQMHYLTFKTAIPTPSKQISLQRFCKPTHQPPTFTLSSS